MMLLTIPETRYDRALHALPIAVCDLQRGQPVNVPMVEGSGGKLWLAEPVDPMSPLRKANGVVLEDALGGHGVKVAIGQIAEGENAIYVAFEQPVSVQGEFSLTAAQLGIPPELVPEPPPPFIGHPLDTGVDLRTLIREIVREELARWFEQVAKGRFNAE